MIGGRELLANLAVVEHLEDARRHIGEHVVLQRELHLVRAPHLLGLGLRVLHLLLEVVLHRTLHVGAQIAGLQSLLACRGQRGDVLADELLELLLIVVAHEGEGEVGGIAVELLPDLEHAVVADGLDHLGCRHAVDGVVAVDGAHHGVLKHGLVVLAYVLQLRGNEVDDVGHCLLVLLHVGEVEVDELHEGLEVLRRGGAGKAMRVVVDGELRAALLAGEGLLQVGAHEGAEGTLREHHAGQLNVAALRILQHGVTAVGSCREEYLVGVEVGLLHQHGSTVREGELLEAQCAVGLLLRDGAGLGSLSHERFLLHVVDIGLERLQANGLHSLAHVLRLVVLLAVLFLHGSQAYEVGVVHRDELLGQFVHGLNRNHRGYLLHHLVLVLDGDNGLSIDEVADVLLAVVVGGSLLAVVVGFLQLTEVFRAGTLILRSREAEVLHALQLAQCSSQTFHVLVGLGHHLQRQCIHRARHQVLTVAGTSLHERAVGLLSLLSIAAAHHLCEHVAHVVIHEVLHALFHLVGELLVLHGSEDDAHLLLLVLAHNVDGLIVVGHRHQLHLGCVGRHLDA